MQINDEHSLSQMALRLALLISRGRHPGGGTVVKVCFSESLVARMPEVKGDINITPFAGNKLKLTAFVALFGILLAVVNVFALYT